MSDTAKSPVLDPPLKLDGAVGERGGAGVLEGDVARAEVVATGWLPNAMLLGVTLAFGSMPLPESVTDWPPAFSVACVDPPVPLGVKLTLNVHVPPPPMFARWCSTLIPKSAALAPVMPGPVGFAV